MEAPDRYRIEREIRRASISRWFVATDAEGQPFKIRRIQLDLVDAKERDQLRDAVRRLASRLPALKGGSFERFAGLEENSDYLDLAWAWVETQDYANTPLPRDTASAVADLTQVAAALDLAHRLGIVHGALSPPLISRAGDQVVVSEFLVERAVYSYTIQEGPLVESRFYESPEQIQETGESGASDQFALSAIAYLWLTGRKPFEADKIPTLHYRICKEQPPAPHALNSKLSLAVSEVILKGLAKRPEDRYRSCSEFAAALEKAQDLELANLTVAAGYAGVTKEIDGEKATQAKGMAPPISDPTPFEAVEQSMRSKNPSEAAAPTVSATFFAETSYRYGKDSTVRGKQTTVLLKNTAGRWLKLAFFAGLLTAGGIWLWRSTTPVPQPLPPASDQSVPAFPLPSEAELKAPDTGKIERGITPPTTSIGKQDPRQMRSNLPDRVTTAEKGQATLSGGRPAASPVEASRATKAGPSELHIVTMPSGASITLDGDPTQTCIAPCSLELSARRHTLTASAPGFGVERRIFNVPEDREIVIDLKQNVGTLLVASDPSGATVLVDGIDSGRTPASLRLMVGEHRLVVVKGNLRAEDTVNVTREQLTSRMYRW